MTFAFVFPGQGSQSIGMLASLASAEPLVQETFAEASAVLGYDLWQLCQQGPEELLGSTERTQPAMLTAGVATWRVWRKHGGPIPAAMAGHSLGEYTALVCSGALDFKTAVALVQFRGQAMQAAVPAGQGAMAAILGLEDADVEAACAEAAKGEVVQAANFNSPGQVVIAGGAAAVDRAIEVLKAKGAKRAIKLPVSVPSHSALMQPAAERLADKLKSIEFAQPQVKDIYTVDVRTHRDAASIREALVQQLVKPVRWTETVRAILAGGAKVLIE
ncbi:MAG: ACP S-malonyltransferase, partial [Steroidobacter sp.]